MATAPVTRSELLEATENQWRETEEGLQAATANFEEAVAGSNWNVGDLFRHLCDHAERVPDFIETLRVEGELTDFDPEAENPEGIERLQSRDAKGLLEVLRQAHKATARAIGQLSDAELAAPARMRDMESSVGEIVSMLTIGHEGRHVALINGPGSSR